MREQTVKDLVESTKKSKQPKGVAGTPGADAAGKDKTPAGGAAGGATGGAAKTGGATGGGAKAGGATGGGQKGQK